MGSIKRAMSEYWRNWISYEAIIISGSARSSGTVSGFLHTDARNKSRGREEAESRREEGGGAVLCFRFRTAR